MLTQAEHDQYRADGYLVLHSGLPDIVLDQARRDLVDKYDTQLAAGQYYPRGRLQDAWRYSNAVLAIARAPRILTALRNLYHREPKPFQTLNFPVGTQQPVHSDTIHFNSDPPGLMCGVWVALEDVHPDAGPLVYYPGSQKQPEYTMQDVGVSPVEVNYGRYEDFIRKKIKALRLEPSYGVIEKGQALIWAANLWHGGSAIKDATKTRHSQVTHYFFVQEGCRWYTPMLSEPGRRHWRAPVWIA